jgi:hypothetical protein
MLPAGVERYLSEIARMLRPGGLCVASYFLLNETSLAGVRAHTTFMSFDVEGADRRCRLHDAAKLEAAIALDESFVLQVCERNGLRIRTVRRGAWFAGRTNDQDVVLVEKP